MPDKDRKPSHKDSKDRDKKTPQSPAWERVLLARHVARPHALDFINGLTKDFMELRGDRHFGDDAALIGGIAQFENRAVLVLGNQKGRDTKENIYRNFGSARAEGYRKAFRLMHHAAKFKLPILTFVDTGGAFPGKESEERGIAMAIAENLLLMSRLPVPIISLVTGEGGSGGALAISVADRLLMLENAVYSVASPEGSATILWRDVSQAPAAAEAMKITAPDLLGFGIIDEIVPEPAGGAHTDPNALMATAKAHLLRHLTDLEERYTHQGEAGIKAMLEARYQKYRKIGSWQELSEQQLEQQLEVADLSVVS
ncbi:MAG: Acetyl-coenzyme carboxylase carboxyl transferase subunit alpha [Chloroflexi bacterium]|jgi:acetyl-CoA carboxylase carboxyl transferase subunit alpha|nr:Acetyl-coenzyme carboxylase carboxyl transferase subunit alpha [Chloroflexota bacterium]